MEAKNRCSRCFDSDLQVYLWDLSATSAASTVAFDCKAGVFRSDDTSERRIALAYGCEINSVRGSRSRRQSRTIPTP